MFVNKDIAASTIRANSNVFKKLNSANTIKEHVEHVALILRELLANFDHPEAKNWCHVGCL